MIKVLLICIPISTLLWLGAIEAAIWIINHLSLLLSHAIHG